jgi:hypothetical protein
MAYAEWATKHPEAAADLAALLNAPPRAAAAPVRHEQTEAWAQQQVRLQAAHAGAMAWRNNVGATPSRCPDCGARARPIRYGLANDSAQLNARVKSSDLILAIPRVIRQEDVGDTMAQFGAVETKRPGWTFTGEGAEGPQAAWLALIQRLGGYACFSTGELEL